MTTAEDRGDELVLDGDGAGDTADQKAAADKAAQEKADAEAKAAADADAKAKADADAKAKAEADAKAAKEKEEPRIPKSRFDEAVGKARREAAEAQERLAKAEAELKASKGLVDAEQIEAEILDLDEKLDKAIADGDKTAAKQIRAELRARERTLSDAKAKAEAVYATAVAVEQINYNALVNRMEVEHPELNPDGEKYDQAQVDEVMDLKEAFEAKGLGSTESLQKALKAVYRGGPKPAEDSKAAAEAKAKAEAEAAAKAKADADAAARKEAAVKRGLDTKDNQPAKSDKVGADSDKGGKTGKDADIMKMSEKDFDKMSEDEKRKLRGDDL